MSKKDSPIILTTKKSLNIVPIEYMGDLSEEELLEQEANYFAMSLLMPERFVRYFWECYWSDYYHNVEKLADVFKVSNEIMFRRLQILGLIGK